MLLVAGVLSLLLVSYGHQTSARAVDQVKTIQKQYLHDEVIVRNTIESPETTNVINVPDECDESKEYVEGECREIWRKYKAMTAAAYPEGTPEVANVISVPSTCPEGQLLVNGQCREVWKRTESVAVATTPDITPENTNVISVPNNCKEGEQLVNGQCREIWKAGITQETAQTVSLTDTTSSDSSIALKNVISVPNQCPSGYVADSAGVCRPLWK